MTILKDRNMEGRNRAVGKSWGFVSMPLRHTPRGGQFAQTGVEGFRSRPVLDLLLRLAVQDSAETEQSYQI